jgi:integrase
MRWQDLDLVSAVWHLPAADSKSGKPITIPLSPVALRAIEATRAHSEGHTHLFPGPGKKGHIVEPRKPWLRLCAAAKISDLRMHDVRRTLGSWLTAHGAPTALVMKALGHKSLQAAQVYQRLDVSSVRAAIEHVGEKMNLSLDTATNESTRATANVIA